MSLKQDPTTGTASNTVAVDNPALTGKQADLVVPTAQNPSNVAVPLESDAAGNLKVCLQSDATIGSPIGPDAQPVAAKDASGDAQNIQVDASGYLEVNVKAGSGGALSVTEGGPVGTVGTPIVGEDDSGNAKFPKVRSNGTIRTEMLPYLYNIAEGNVPSHNEVYKHADAIVAVTTKTLLVSGVWAEQTAGAQRSIKSSSVNDAAAGTGIRKVELRYISSIDGTEKTEVITMNGVTAVDTVATDIKWVNGIESIDVGTVQAADGLISMYTAAAGGGVVMAEIIAGQTELLVGVIYAPAGKTLFIVRAEMTSNDKTFFDFIVTRDKTGIGGGANTPHLHHRQFIDKKGGDTDLPAPLAVSQNQKLSVFVTPDAVGMWHGVHISGWTE